MTRPRIALAFRAFDYLYPLACGDVTAEGIDLDLQRDARAMYRALGDPTVDGGEVSFSRHLLRLARGDRSIVGLPIMIARAFRHRVIWIRRDSGLRDVKDLAGKRIGTNEWPATGITWTRAILREQGVRLEDITWWAGQIDQNTPVCDHGILPPHARQAPPDRMLRDMLLEGELDALMCPHAPMGFYEPNSPIVRLYPDFRPVERAYFLRTGIFPAHHILGLRRETFERHPWVVRSLYRAFEESMRHWRERRGRLGDTTPWLSADLEDAEAVMGEEWWPHGIEPNRHVIEALCEEEFAQGLIEQPMDPNQVFAEFEEVGS